MLFRFWLHFPPLLILLSMLAVFAVAGTATHWLQCRSMLANGMKGRILAAPTFVAVSTLFALFAAFLLAGAIEQKNRAVKAVQAESAALLTLSVNSRATAGSGDAIRASIRAYARSVVADEWPELPEERGSDGTEAALLGLMQAVRDGPVADGTHTAVVGQMLALVQQVAGARAERIAIVSNHLQQFAWTALFLLGFVTQFGIGLAHVDRPAANATAIAFFSTGAVIALWLIAIQDNPFRGVAAVSPEPIERVLAVVDGG